MVRTVKHFRNCPTTAEDYDERSQAEHIYKTPDTFVGSDEKMAREEWVLDCEEGKMIRLIVDIPQAVERIFLEILSNAGDNAYSSRTTWRDVGEISVVMDSKSITVTNGGSPIPITINKKSGLYIPEMIFGRLLTSSNYNSDIVRMGCGRNGYGAKLGNIFSTFFEITIGDPINKLRYHQQWEKRSGTPSLGVPSKAQITTYDDPTSFVRVTYTLDFERFGYDEYPDTAFYLFARHTADMGMTCKVPVFFNDVPLPTSDFRSYAQFYFDEEVVKTGLFLETPGIDETGIPSFEIALFDTPDSGESVGFVNGMVAKRGGVHIESVLKAFSDQILGWVNCTTEKSGKGKNAVDKSRKYKLTLSDLRPHVSLIVSFRATNPKWDSQSKESLTAPKPEFNLGDLDKTPVRNWHLVDRLFAALEAKDYKALLKTDGKKRRHLGPIKGEDANLAGTKQSDECFLLVVEGRSAMGYAVRAIDHIEGGRDVVGVMPLKGKPLNVKNASPKQIAENTELVELKKMLGLREGVIYDSEEEMDTLRYGHLIILADADDDGKHIVGLILNIFFWRYPDLLKRGFVMFLRTPILRVHRGDISEKFFTQFEYEEWRDHNSNYKLWEHDYYKGLGSSNKEEIRDDFKDPKYVICVYDERTPESMALAFDSKRSNARKKWIAEWSPILGIEGLEYQDISQYIEEEMTVYWKSSIIRAIPRLMDGLKESQGKALWAAFQHWGSKTRPQKYKVAQLASEAAKVTNYKHGEKCLADTIIGMAQDFVGSNNLPFFTRDGEFGTRNLGGKDCAEARYGQVRPETWLPFVFRSEDTPLLERIEDEGKQVEPSTFLPIVPMCLINGADGIGTGHSTFIPKHDPLQIIAWLRARLTEQELPTFRPWYRGFKGTIKILKRGAWRGTNKVDQDQEKSRKSKDKNKIVLPESDIMVEPQFSVGTGSGQEALIDPDVISDPAQEGPDEISDDELSEDENGVITGHPTMVTIGKYTDENKVVTITELPIGRWTHNYLVWLDQLIADREIKEYRNASSAEAPYFELTGFKNSSLEKLRLCKAFGLTNFVLLNEKNNPVHYSSTNEIAEAFFQERFAWYQHRKDYSLDKITKDLATIDVKIRFIYAVLEKDIILVGQSREKEVIPKMKAMQLPTELLSQVRAGNFTQEEIDELNEKYRKMEDEHKVLSETQPSDMWLRDLDEFEFAYDSWLQSQIEINTGDISCVKGKGKGKRGGRRTRATGQRRGGKKK